MKNMIKMSLVAAVAVAGFSSTVAAKPLEESIKDVDFSGYLRYRYTNGETKAVDQNQYRVQATTKAKVNDNVTAKFAVQGDANSTDTAGDVDGTAATIRELNFTVKGAGATVIVGKQGLVTPFADSGLDSQQGTGVVALYPVGPVTLAAGHYLNSDATTNVTGSEVSLKANNITALAVIGAAGPVNYAAWYAMVNEQEVATGIDAGANALNLNVAGTVGPVDLELNYAQVDYTSDTTSTIDEVTTKQTRVVASFDADVVKLTAGVIFAGNEGGDTTLGDGDAQSNFIMEEFSGAALEDTTAYYVGVKAPVGPVTLGLEHGRTSDVDGNAAGDISFSETKLSASYAMSKNFTVSGWITETSGDVDGDTDYSEMGANRIEIKYTF